MSIYVETSGRVPSTDVAYLPRIVVLGFVLGTYANTRKLQ